jgi:hypothetical protein
LNKGLDQVGFGEEMGTGLAVSGIQGFGVNDSAVGTAGIVCKSGSTESPY